LIRGKWIEIDSTRLEEVLEYWRAVEKEAGDGLSFIEGMRLLSGAALHAEDRGLSDENIEAWSSRMAGGWLAKVLEELHHPEPEALGLDGEGS
jgi:non-specific serine/threonine protein kinase